MFGALALPADGYSPAVYGLIAAGYALTALTYALATRQRSSLRPLLPTTPPG